jgi:hypothetical protein
MNRTASNGNEGPAHKGKSLHVPRRRLNVRARIRAEAVVLLHDRPEGVRFTDLVDALHRGHSDKTIKSIGNDIIGLDRALPTQVVKPSKGLYQHSRFAVDTTLSNLQHAGKPRAPRRASAALTGEQQFYGPFATWLRDDLEEVTHAIELGGNVFRDRWGTPDVLGKYESKRSDVVKGTIIIVAAEIKIDTSELLTGFGQACAYRLWAHKSYLVIPQQAPPAELDRLEAICHMSGIGLVTFDAQSPSKPGFRRVTRPVKHDPDLSYTNRYIRPVEARLFA